MRRAGLMNEGFCQDHVNGEDASCQTRFSVEISSTAFQTYHRVGDAAAEITRQTTTAPILSRRYARKEGCVALALQGETTEIARLASQCLELLGSQSVTAVKSILS